MSNTSVGVGGGKDSNENPPADSRPSKTMGAESGPDEMRPGAAGATDSSGHATASDVLTAPDERLRAVPTSGVPLDPRAFPDGPNVAPSPWEKDAAQGKV